MMKMRVLLAIDDSKFSEGALRMMSVQHRPQDTKVRILHVVEPIETIAFSEAALAEAGIVDKLQQEKLDRGRELVARASKKLQAAGFQVDTAVHTGDSRTAVVDVAEKWGADLIVVGSHGRSGLDRFLIGSVSEFVARHAPCSVEIVRLRTKRRVAGV